MRLRSKNVGQHLVIWIILVGQVHQLFDRLLEAIIVPECHAYRTLQRWQISDEPTAPLANIIFTRPHVTPITPVYDGFVDVAQSKNFSPNG